LKALFAPHLSKEAALLLGRLGELLHGAVGQVLLAAGDVLLAIASQRESGARELDLRGWRRPDDVEDDVEA